MCKYGLIFLGRDKRKQHEVFEITHYKQTDPQNDRNMYATNSSGISIRHASESKGHVVRFSHPVGCSGQLTTHNKCHIRKVQVAFSIRPARSVVYFSDMHSIANNSASRKLRENSDSLHDGFGTARSRGLITLDVPVSVSIHSHLYSILSFTTIADNLGRPSQRSTLQPSSSLESLTFWRMDSWRTTPQNALKHLYSCSCADTDSVFERWESVEPTTRLAIVTSRSALHLST